jgi:dihydrofolate reductase
MLTLIAAVDKNLAIGHQGQMPWHHPQDLAFFQQETKGGVVLMGRRTWESLPTKPLPNRVNLVVTRTPLPGVLTFPTPQDALTYAQTLPTLRIYCIGGQQLYTALLPYADRLVLTHLAHRVEQADTWFPPLPAHWRCVHTRVLEGTPQATVREYFPSPPSA